MGRKPSLGWRFTLVSAAVVVFSGALTVALFIFFLPVVGRSGPRISATEMDHAVHKLAPDLGRHWQERGAWRGLFTDFRRANHLDPVKLTVLGADGMVLYREGDLVARFPMAGSNRLTRAGLVGLLAGKSHLDKEDLIYVVAPIERHGAPIGVLLGELRPYSAYRYSPRPVMQYLIFLLPGLATIFVSAVAGICLARGLRGRLDGLARAIHGLAEGDYRGRLAPGPDDEIGRVAAAFNRMADRLAEARAQEEALERLKSELVTNVTHDLRGPLASIQGYLEALADGLPRDPETAGRYIGIIRAKSEQLTHLVEDLLLYARLESGELPMHLEKLDVAEWLRESLANAEPDVAAAGLWLEAEIPETGGMAHLDRRQMDRVVANLVQNAVRYAPQGTVLLVTLAREDGRAAVSFRDEGPGLDPADLPHLFDRFYRGRTLADGVGTGLGLAIAAQIVRAQGGSIRAANRPGGGAEIVFTLPLQFSKS